MLMRTRLGLSLAASVVGAVHMAQPARSRSSSAVLPLASSTQSSQRATAVLVHGLDSSKETWAGVLADLAAAGYPAIAYDLRGHGESPLGEPDEFGPAALASDVLAAVHAAGISRCVLVGHSMGGRIAMRAAAIEAASAGPSTLKAVVIEDMDISPRTAPELSAEKRRDVAAWGDSDGAPGRKFASWEQCRAALLPWYDADEARVDSWRGKRVRSHPDKSWWSDINPLARRLAWEHVLASDDGTSAWRELAKRSGSGGLPFSVHLWFADQPGSVVKEGVGEEGGIPDMSGRFPAVRVRKFSGAAHSIHNTARSEFVSALCALVDEVSLEGAEEAAAATQQDM